MISMNESDYNKIVMMDTRTWLAGQALSGLCANPALSDAVAKRANQSRDMPARTYAVMAREIADATLAELAKEKP